MSDKNIATNRKASFTYELMERCEAGMVLTGSEVKSLRDGKANLGDAYAVFRNDELWLINAHISEYAPAAGATHTPLRSRKLLLHRRELNKLIGQLQQKGLTLIPTRLYFREGRAKCELALARGKKVFDKREAIKKRETRREIARTLHHKNMK